MLTLCVKVGEETTPTGEAFIITARPRSSRLEAGTR